MHGATKWLCMKHGKGDVKEKRKEEESVEN